jgi:hypothetical protein
MTAEYHEPSYPTPNEVSSFASAYNRRHDLYDPFQDEPSHVIAHFLVDAGHFKEPEAAMQYISRLLGDDDQALPHEQAMRDRLLGLVDGDSKGADEEAEENDEAIRVIEKVLFDTFSRARQFKDLRGIYRNMLRLRSIDIEQSEQDQNLERWQRLLHTLGEKALE